MGGGFGFLESEPEAFDHFVGLSAVFEDLGPLSEEVGVTGEAFGSGAAIVLVVLGDVEEDLVEEVHASEGSKGGREFAGHELNAIFDFVEGGFELLVGLPEEEAAGEEAGEKEEGEGGESGVAAGPDEGALEWGDGAGEDGAVVEPALEVFGEGGG